MNGKMSGAKAVQPVQIFTDGSCIGNPGPGGWAAILRYGDTTRELSGGFQATTNNRMELRAAIEGLAALKRPCLVELYSDSQYVRRGITEWTRLWQANGWKTAAKQPVKNRDLWERLDALVTRHDVRFVKVKGHADDALNNRVDGLAVEAMRARMAEAAG